MEKIWIIGNADEVTSVNHLVGASDIVVRINNPNPSCTLKADFLFLLNSYSATRKLRADPFFIKPTTKVFYRFTMGSIIKNNFFCHYSPYKKVKYCYKFSKMLLWHYWYTRSYDFLNVSLIYQATKALELTFGQEPSTGFLALFYCLQKHKNIPIVMHNFTFQGWEGHNWVQEKMYVERLINEGRVEFIA